MSAIALSNPDQDTVIRFEDIGRAYQMGVETIHALQSVSLTITRNEYVAIMGASGSGKSTLMRIMAGLDTEIVGEARAADGIKIGYLPQEPELDPAKDVAGNVFEGVAEIKALLDRFEEVSAGFAEEDAWKVTRR